MKTVHRTFRVNEKDWGDFCKRIAEERGPGKTGEAIREFIQAAIQGRVKRSKAEVVERKTVVNIEIASSPNM